MPDLNACIFEESSAHFINVENPIGIFVCHFFDPTVTRHARIDTEDVFEPLVLPHPLDYVPIHQLVYFSLRVEWSRHLSVQRRQPNDVFRHKVAHLVEEWVEVFVVCSDHIVLLESAVLQDAEEGPCFVVGGTHTVQQGKGKEVLHVDFFTSRLHLCGFEGVREQHLRQDAVFFL